MWSMSNHEDVAKRLKKYQKKWRHEITNVFDNLDTLFLAIKEGTKPEQLKSLGFVHSEPMNVLAIDQKGPGKGTRMKQFRLYTVPDLNDEVLYLRTLGDKDTQEDDLRVVTAFAQALWAVHTEAERGDV